MTWSNTYVGIPYRDLGRRRSGCDCWGLACLVYAFELGITLPSYQTAYSSAADTTAVSALLDRRHTSPWVEVAGEINPFDLLLLRQGRFDTHVGIALDAFTMLHMARGDAAKIERLDSPIWRLRHVGTYRHCDIPQVKPEVQCA